MTPRRVQRRRTKDVRRRWGNPWMIERCGTAWSVLHRPTGFETGPYGDLDTARQAAVDAYRLHLLVRKDIAFAAMRDLAGRDLACWCAPGPCHADVLLRLANPHLEDQ